jgi:chemotaxis protein methyltransferase CheR
MKNECAIFLQWALPQMKMRWSGFRKVHKQVCKRIRHRMNTLNLPNFGEYQSWLTNHPKEWDVLDSMCRITISRFYRDWAVFDFLMDNLLHSLAKKAKHENRPFRCWSAGCASGEEPYTLALIWHFVLRKKFPALDFQIIATDIDERLLERAKIGCYPKGSLKGLPKPWLNKAFSVNESGYCIHSSFSKSIKWIKQDIRISFPSGTFDLLLCRNLVATYFEPSLQRAIFNQMKAVLRPGGFLVLGCHEKLPEEIEGFSSKLEKLNIYEMSANPIFFNTP